MIIHFENHIVRKFHHCVSNIVCIYINLDGINESLSPDEIDRRWRHERYGAAAGITWHTVFQQTF